MSATAQAVPYLVLGAARRRALEMALTQIVARWRERWAGPSAKTGGVSLENDCARLSSECAATASVLQWTTGGQVLLQMIAAPHILSALAGAVPAAGAFQAPPERDSLAEALQMEILSSLGALFAETAGRRDIQLQRTSGTVADAVRAAARRRSLAAAIGLGSPGAVLSLLLDPTLVEALAPPRPAARRAPPLEALTPHSALDEQTLVVEVCLDETEIGFGELVSLRAGDVIVLNQALNQPPRVVVRDGRCFAEGELGCAGERLAVRIGKFLAPLATAARH